MNVGKDDLNTSILEVKKVLCRLISVAGILCFRRTRASTAFKVRAHLHKFKPNRHQSLENKWKLPKLEKECIVAFYFLLIAPLYIGSIIGSVLC